MKYIFCWCISSSATLQWKMSFCCLLCSINHGLRSVNVGYITSTSGSRIRLSVLTMTRTDSSFSFIVFSFFGDSWDILISLRFILSLKHLDILEGTWRFSVAGIKHDNVPASQSIPSNECPLFSENRSVRQRYNHNPSFYVKHSLSLLPNIRMSIRMSLSHCHWEAGIS